MTFSKTKVSFFTNNKDRTPLLSKSNVIYRLCCPGCSATYFRKTDRNLHERCVEHATMCRAIFDHLCTCEQLNDLNKMMMYDLPTLDKDGQRFLNINVTFRGKTMTAKNSARSIVISLRYCSKKNALNVSLSAIS